MIRAFSAMPRKTHSAMRPAMLLSKTICLFGATLLPFITQAQSGQWNEPPPLPVAVSGHFAGDSRGALITVGGAHFPIPLYEGGTKKWLPDIQVLPPGGKTWQ